MAIRFIIAIILLSLLGGCAITPNAPSVTLGSDWAGPEELANATMFVKPPHIDQAKGFEIAIPSGVAPLGCKTWPNLDGQKVRVCRKATRVKIDGREKVSAYPYQGSWYVFSESRPYQVEILSYDGRVVESSITREISVSEMRGVYADMAATFNCVSPMGLLYTDPSGQCRGTAEKLDIPELGVPSLNDNMERCAYAGLCRVTTNPVSYVGGAISYALSKPRQLNGK